MWKCGNWEMWKCSADYLLSLETVNGSLTLKREQGAS